MDQGAKQYLAKKLITGHQHELVTSWLMCATCGPKFQQWKAEKEKLRRTKPELFERRTKREAALDDIIFKSSKKVHALAPKDSLITANINEELRKFHA